MLYFFLDDSGTDARSPVITMAGYVALAHHWAIFDKRAKKLYDQRGITRLHASEFHGTKGEFAKWSGDKKMDFVRELFMLVRKCCVLGVSVSVLKDGYIAAGKREGLNKNISAYGMCFNIIVEHIRNAKNVAALAHHGVSFRVEKGNKNDPDVGQRFEYFAEHEKLVDVIRTMEFVDKGHSAAIQLADFLAFYSRRHAEKCERDRNAKATHDEPLATMLRIFEPHRGLLANDFFGKQPGHDDLPGVG
jgi:Protein of unknown function (DUF3800)